MVVAGYLRKQAPRSRVRQFLIFARPHSQEMAFGGPHAPRLTVRSLGYACSLLKAALIRYNRGSFSNEDQQRSPRQYDPGAFFTFDPMVTGAASVVSGAVALLGKCWRTPAKCQGRVSAPVRYSNGLRVCLYRHGGHRRARPEPQQYGGRPLASWTRKPTRLLETIQASRVRDWSGTSQCGSFVSMGQNGGGPK